MCFRRDLIAGHGGHYYNPNIQNLWGNGEAILAR